MDFRMIEFFRKTKTFSLFLSYGWMNRPCDDDDDDNFKAWQPDIAAWIERLYKTKIYIWSLFHPSLTDAMH